jgi:hypothetical protein
MAQRVAPLCSNSSIGWVAWKSLNRNALPGDEAVNPTRVQAHLEVVQEHGSPFAEAGQGAGRSLVIVIDRVFAMPGHANASADACIQALQRNHDDPMAHADVPRTKMASPSNSLREVGCLPRRRRHNRFVAITPAAMNEAKAHDPFRKHVGPRNGSVVLIRSACPGPLSSPRDSDRRLR